MKQWSYERLLERCVLLELFVCLGNIQDDAESATIKHRYSYKAYVLKKVITRYHNISNIINNRSIVTTLLDEIKRS